MGKVTLYMSPSGRTPVADYIANLNAESRAKVARALDLLEQYGPALGPPHVKPLKGTGGLCELRVPFGGQAYRLFFFPDGGEVIVTHAFTKKSEKTPKKELQTAISRMKEYQERRLRK
ncbi:MAG: type II toxin-antitoxin system RelE/ParE family toxin [Clostridia bacterium]|nr:MAG: type II toxin-antitoxin system RelE/ParE family toxin [Clostridia bacterium]